MPAGSYAIPPVASLDITYATAWKANYSKDHYDDEPDAGVGVEGENFKKFTCQRARHGRRLPVSFTLFLRANVSESEQRPTPCSDKSTLISGL